MDANRIAIIPFEGNIYGFDKGVPVKLTRQELCEIEKLISENTDKYNNDVDAKDKIILANYKRQYVAIKNEKGEKEVWVNCFCGHNAWDGWKKQLLLVNDGGNCYFNLKINLTQRRCYDLWVNDSA